MSFGRRATKTIDRQQAQPPSRVSGKLMAAGLAALVVGVGAYFGYTNRDVLALKFYPNALLMMPTMDRQLEGNWFEDYRNSSQAAATVRWTLEQMGRLCGDTRAIVRAHRMEAFLKGLDNRKMNEEAALASTSPNLYRVKRINASDFIEYIGRQPKQFCEREYIVAQYDGRIAAIHYGNKAIKEGVAAANRGTAVIKELDDLIYKMKNGITLTKDQRQFRDCLQLEGSPDSKRISRCYEELSERRRSMPPDEQSGESIRSLSITPRASVGSQAPATPSIALQVGSDRPSVNIEMKCSREWQGDYRMQEYCINKQRDARDWARSASISSEIAQKCAAEWPEDWRMFTYCSKKQQAAKQRLQ